MIGPFGALEITHGLGLAAILAAISVIDLRQRRIPNVANAMLVAGGISYWWFHDPGALPLQLASGVAVFAVFWIVRAVHLRSAKRTGLGLGDVKMAGASAVWFHPLLFPAFLLTASTTAIVAVVLATRGNRAEISTYQLPFAPFLSLGLFATWILEVSGR